MAWRVRAAWTALVLGCLAPASAAEPIQPTDASVGGAIRADGLSGADARVWRAILRVVRARDEDGRLLHPTLHALYREVDASGHVVRIEMPSLRGSSGVAGRFRIVATHESGPCRAAILLHLRVIDRALPGRPAGPGVPLDTPDRAERYAQVLGHELAHAAWAFAEPGRLRLVAAVQQRSQELARRALTEGAWGDGFSEALAETESLVREIERPALAAEAVIAAELRRSR